MAEPVRVERGWALFTPQGYIFMGSTGRLRSHVVEYANRDASPGWNWKRYRKAGFHIAKIEIRRPASPEGSAS